MLLDLGCLVVLLGCRQCILVEIRESSVRLLELFLDARVASMCDPSKASFRRLRSRRVCIRWAQYHAGNILKLIANPAGHVVSRDSFLQLRSIKHKLVLDKLVSADFQRSVESSLVCLEVPSVVAGPNSVCLEVDRAQFDLVDRVHDAVVAPSLDLVNLEPLYFEVVTGRASGNLGDGVSGDTGLPRCSSPSGGALCAILTVILMCAQSCATTLFVSVWLPTSK